MHAGPLWASLHTYIGLSGLLWASLGLYICASLCLSEALWGSLGLSGPLWELLYVRHLLGPGCKVPRHISRVHTSWGFLGCKVPPGSTSTHKAPPGAWLQGTYHGIFPRYLLGLFRLQGTTAYFDGMYLLGLFRLQGTTAYTFPWYLLVPPGSTSKSPPGAWLQGTTAHFHGTSWGF